jgi:hypothetical protein
MILSSVYEAQNEPHAHPASNPNVPARHPHAPCTQPISHGRAQIDHETKLVISIIITPPSISPCPLQCHRRQSSGNFAIPCPPLTGKYPVNLNDLRTPTPYTWTLSALASGCDTAPTTFTNHYMWFIARTPFPAINTVTQTLTEATLVKYFETFTFPQMTVTSLYPGEPLSLVSSPIPGTS